MKKIPVWLCVLVILGALILITLSILDEFNPLMALLTGRPSKIFQLIFSILCIALAVTALRRNKSK